MRVPRGVPQDVPCPNRQCECTGTLPACKTSDRCNFHVDRVRSNDVTRVTFPASCVRCNLRVHIDMYTYRYAMRVTFLVSSTLYTFGLVQIYYTSHKRSDVAFSRPRARDTSPENFSPAFSHRLREKIHLSEDPV